MRLAAGSLALEIADCVTTSGIPPEIAPRPTPNVALQTPRLRACP
jgi:hypothetical protein